MTAITSPANAMIVLTRLRRTLVESTDLEQIHEVRDRAEAVRQYQ